MNLLCTALFSCLLALLSVVAEGKPSPCARLGPAFPYPTQLASSHSFRRSLDLLSYRIGAALKDPTSGIDAENVTFSLNLYTVTDEKPIYEYHHVATRFQGSLPKGGLNGDSVYRTGSISKVFAVYTFLAAEGFKYFQDPITKYIPELAAIPVQNEIDQPRWDEVTVGSLATHLSGIFSDVTVPDLSQDPTLPIPNGAFPPIGPNDRMRCGFFPPLHQCSRKEIFDGLKLKHPIYQAFSSSPAYSNTAFTLLAFALEKITGKSFEKVMDEEIVKPLGLTRTSLEHPIEDSWGVIPFNNSLAWWNISIGLESPAGGVYSTSNDLARFGRSILGSALLKPVDTRRFLNPASSVGVLDGSVGIPWEIYRTTEPRIIDLTTKGGSIGLYNSHMILVRDFNIGVTVLAAGNRARFTKEALADLFVETLIPRIEEEARREAYRHYAGKYHAPGRNSSIVLGVDRNQPGLVIESFVSNGTDMIALVKSLFASDQSSTMSLRLHPTLLKAESECPRSMNSNSCVDLSFRAVLDEQTVASHDENRNQQVIGGLCKGQWFEADSLVWGRVALDDFKFTVDRGSGNAISLEPRALKVKLYKV
ncbi:hypothetical protein FQN57_006093 [Myotisia sp. PD_48]|nr:hypothetical protein FQN57_006093 [Myotisia sp. PD_48]